MYLDFSLNDVIAVEQRLADFNEMLDLVNTYWDEKRPAVDLQSIFWTVQHINALLIKELQEITAQIDDKIFEERKGLIREQERKALANADMRLYLEIIDGFFSYDENIEYLKANGRGFEKGHADEDMRLFGGVLTGFLTGRAFEKNVVGKGEEAREYLAKLKGMMAAGQAGAGVQEGEVAAADVETEAGSADVGAGMENGQADESEPA